MKIIISILVSILLLTSCAGVESLRTEKLNKTFLEAAGIRDIESVKNHLELGANINNRDREGNTAVHLAVKNEDIILFELLVEKRANLNIKNFKSMTPLHQAIQMMDFDGDLLCMLLDKGADPDITDQDGNTALHMAVKTGVYSIHLVTVLVESGAEVNIKNNNGNTPIDVVKYNYWAFDYLRRHGGQVTITPKTILEAAKYGDMVKLCEFLKAGADINTEDRDGITPLHYAAEYNEVDMVRLLIKNGADISLSAGGDSPFHEAVRAGNLEIVEIFLDNGADINEKSWICDDAWELPIHIAAESGNVRTIKMLLEKGVDIDSLDCSKQTPLHSAIIKNKIEAVEFLIKRGADVNIRECQGNTPLDYSEYEETTKLLIKNGAKTGKELQEEDK